MTRVHTSTSLFQRASAVIPGGVNSPVRAWGAVGAGEPFFAARGEGAYLWDSEGNRYVDWVMSWGPLLFGHADPEVVEAVQEAAADGTTFGAPTEREVALAEELVDAVPSVEKVRLVSSGTEAAMSVLRLARGATGRDRILKFSGCYHGHADALLAAAGSGIATLGIPSSPGVPAGAAADTLVCAFNDVEGVSAAVERTGEELAAIVVEPVAGNMGVVPPEPGFLEALRTLADSAGALLVFDEVITGFRVARGGAQERYGVLPDLTFSARSPAAACRWRRSEGGARSWTSLHRPGRSTRPAPSPAIRLPPLPPSSSFGVCGIQACTRCWRKGAPGSRRGCATLPPARPPASSGSARWRRSSSTKGRCGASRTLRRATRSATAPGSATFWPAVTTSRRRSSRHSSSRRRTARPRSTRWWRPRVSSLPADLGIWATIADEAGRESALWAAALRPEPDRDDTPVFSALADDRHALGLESIYEGYLLHYGRPRLFGPADSDTAILLGDYLYAHGLVRVAAHGEVAVVSDLAELISLCAQLRAEERDGDGAAWAGTVALLGTEDGRLENARAALRLNGDPEPLLAVAELEAGPGAVGRALALHATLLGWEH